MFGHWRPGLCLSGGLATAMKWRGEATIAQFIRGRFATKASLVEVRHALASAPEVTKLYDVYALKPEGAGKNLISGQNSLCSVLARRDREEIIALWMADRCVVVDMQLAAVFDVHEASPLSLPDDNHAAIELLSRLTASPGAPAQLRGGIVLYRKPTKTARRRGRAGGKRKRKAPPVLQGSDVADSSHTIPHRR